MPEGQSGGRLPDFLIVGEMKCGTTTFWELLSLHPRVFLPEEKELHFFSSYENPEDPRWPEDIDRYCSYFEPARGDQRCGEATPNYMADPVACQRIKDTLPDAKLFVILRDPIRRAWSHHWHSVRSGVEDLSFESALDAEESRCHGSFAECGQHAYVRRGRYIERLLALEALFGRAQISVIFLEDIMRSTNEALSPAFAHLGIEPVPCGTVPHSNRASYPKWRTVSRLTQRAMRWARARGGIVLAAATSVRKNARPLVYYEGKPRMSERIRARLQEEFKESNRELAKWLDRPVPWVGEESKVDITGVAKNHTPIGGPADE